MFILLQQRKTEDAELVDEEAKKAKPSEETNGEGGEPNGKEAESEEQAPVSYIQYTHFPCLVPVTLCKINYLC